MHRLRHSPWLLRPLPKEKQKEARLADPSLLGWGLTLYDGLALPDCRQCSLDCGHEL